jgi:hypothetical protein
MSERGIAGGYRAALGHYLPFAEGRFRVACVSKRRPLLSSHTPHWQHEPRLAEHLSRDP